MQWGESAIGAERVVSVESNTAQKIGAARAQRPRASANARPTNCFNGSKPKLGSGWPLTKCSRV